MQRRPSFKFPGAPHDRWRGLRVLFVIAFWRNRDCQGLVSGTAILVLLVLKSASIRGGGELFIPWGGREVSQAAFMRSVPSL